MTVEIETDPDGKRITGVGDMSFFPLYAMIPSEDIYLYGVRPYGMVLYQNGKGTYFEWPGLMPRRVLPEMRYHDFDGDGNKELAVIMLVGSGTGVHVMDLHILKVKENYDDWGSDRYKPTYTEYTLYEKDVENWMTEPITITFAEDKKSFVVDTCGGSHTGKNDSYSDLTFSGVAYGDIVYFSFEGTQIRTKIAIGAFYEEYVTPQFLGDIEADVTFNGDSFKLENYTFTIRNQ